MLYSSSDSHNSLQGQTVMQRPRPAWQHLLLIIAYTLAAMFIGQFLAVVFSMLLFGIGFNEIEGLLANLNHPSIRSIIYLIQAFTAVCGFIIGPLLYLKHWGQSITLTGLINNKKLLIIPLLLTVVLTICLMVANGPLIQWNADWQLPSALNDFELWARGLENSAANITKLMVQFTSLPAFVLGLIVLAVIPAVGEELLFRGLIQPALAKITGNAHIGIWLAALVFSLFHFQFFGLLPRMALGVIFGYLFYWSGSLWYPVIAHFINNGLTLTLVYASSLGYLNFNIEEPDSLPATVVLVCLAVGLGLFVFFRNYFRKNISA